MPLMRILPHKITTRQENLDLHKSSYRNQTSFKLQVANNTGRNLSSKSTKKVEEAIAWLVYLSRKKRALNPKTLKHFNFRINFITLTLPSLQAHLDTTITSQCLNQFLTECRKTFNLRNYVWRGEPQSNGNIHFHIISDTYLNAYVVRSIWNRCINKLGYVDRYKAKFSKCSLSEYNSLVNSKGRLKLEDVKRSWLFGVKTNWEMPNTTDVHSTRNIKNLAAYLSKYVTKKTVYLPDSESPISRKEKSTVVYELKERRLKCRLWGCSQSLSKIKAPSHIIEYRLQRFLEYIHSQFNHKYFSHDFGAVYRVHMQEYAHKFKDLLLRYRDSILSACNYLPSLQTEQRYFESSVFAFVPDS